MARDFIIKNGILERCVSDKAKLTVPQGVTAIAPEAFRGNLTAEQIRLPEGLKRIGERAFRGCCMLLGINIPASVESIGAEAFDDCSCLCASCPGSTLCTAAPQGSRAR